MKNDMHQTKTNFVSPQQSWLSVFKITNKWPLHMLGSSRPDVFPKKVALKNVAKFTTPVPESRF